MRQSEACFALFRAESRGVPDLVDLYRMAVANMEFLDNTFSSKRLESTLVPRVLIHPFPPPEIRPHTLGLITSILP